MTVVFLILTLVAVIGSPSIERATTGVALAVMVPWALVVLGLGTLALLSRWL